MPSRNGFRMFFYKSDRTGSFHEYPEKSLQEEKFGIGLLVLEDSIVRDNALEFFRGEDESEIQNDDFGSGTERAFRRIREKQTGLLVKKI